jgi:hypothetical protein
MKNFPTCSIIILNYNGKAFLKKCLDSVLKTDYPNFKIILIDNASTDGSVEFLKSYYGSDPRLRIICNERNLGIAGGRNIGIGEVKEKYVVFLDNDTEVHKDWLIELVEVLENDPMIGAAQSKILDIINRDTIQCAGGYLVPYVCCSVMRGIGKVDNGSYDHIENVCAMGAALAIRRKILDEVGFLDPEFSFSHDDVDISWRIWLSGYRVVLAPKSIVYHWKKKKVIRRQIYREHDIYNISKNTIRMMIKNYSAQNLIKYLPLMVSSRFFQACLHLLLWKDIVMTLGLFHGIYWNLMHLKDTLKERTRIQCKVKKVKDEDALRHFMRNVSPFFLYQYFYTERASRC